MIAEMSGSMCFQALNLKLILDHVQSNCKLSFDHLGLVMFEFSLHNSRDHGLYGLPKPNCCYSRVIKSPNVLFCLMLSVIN